jgi:putative acetyltransferase
VNEAAFETPSEADIVDALREKSGSLISLVAETEGQIVGHILFSPVSLADQPGVALAGLGPMAVSPQHQRRGIGSALVRRGLEPCRDRGYGAVVVLGHAAYYPRFGFVPASRHGIASDYDVPDDVFMVAELRPGWLQGVFGRVTYDRVFSSV